MKTIKASALRDLWEARVHVRTAIRALARQFGGISVSVLSLVCEGYTAEVDDEGMVVMRPPPEATPLAREAIPQGFEPHLEDPLARPPHEYAFVVLFRAVYTPHGDGLREAQREISTLLCLEGRLDLRSDGCLVYSTNNGAHIEKAIMFVSLAKTLHLVPKDTE